MQSTVKKRIAINAERKPDAGSSEKMSSASKPREPEPSPRASTSKDSMEMCAHCSVNCHQGATENDRPENLPEMSDHDHRTSLDQSTYVYLWARKKARVENRRTQSLKETRRRRLPDVETMHRQSSIEVLCTADQPEGHSSESDSSTSSDSSRSIPDPPFQDIINIFNRYYEGEFPNDTFLQEFTGEVLLAVNTGQEQGGNLPPVYNTGEETTAQCEVCYTVTLLQLRTCCNLPVCDECLQVYFSQSVIEGIVKIECPSPECKKYVDRDEILGRLPAELKEKFYRFLVEANKDPYVKTCPRCNHVTQLDEALKFLLHNKYGIKQECAECGLSWCFACQAPYHDGITCRDYKKGDKLLRNWAKKHYNQGQLNAQRCPKCKIFIQKSTGCDHMKCSHCHTNFCYRCGEQYRQFKFIGDHNTRLSIFGCKYRFLPTKPAQRRLIRGSIFGAKVLAAPIIGAGVLVAGAVCVILAGTVVLPFLLPRFIYRRYQYRKLRRLRKEQHAKLRARLEALGKQDARIKILYLPSDELEISVPQSHTYHDSDEDDSDSVLTLSHASYDGHTELHYAEILSHWHEDDLDLNHKEVKVKDDEIKDQEVTQDEEQNEGHKTDVMPQDVSKTDVKVGKTDVKVERELKSESGNSQEAIKIQNLKASQKTSRLKSCNAGEKDSKSEETKDVKPKETGKTEMTKLETVVAGTEAKLETKTETVACKPESQREVKDTKMEKESSLNQKFERDIRYKEETVKVNCTKFFLKLGFVETDSAESIPDVVQQNSEKMSKLDSQNMKDFPKIHTESFVTSL